MRLFVLTLFLSFIPSIAQADITCSESKKKVWNLSCETTFFKLILEEGNGSRSNKELAKGIPNVCKKLSSKVDKENRWQKISSPIENGCYAAIQAMADSNPGWQKKPQDMFAIYCINLSMN